MIERELQERERLSTREQIEAITDARPTSKFEIPPELIIFGSWREMRAVGEFDESGVHRRWPFLRAYCLDWGSPDRLRGVSLSRVLVTGGARRWIYENDRSGFGAWRQVEEMARVMLRLQPMMWIEL